MAEGTYPTTGDASAATRAALRVAFASDPTAARMDALERRVAALEARLDEWESALVGAEDVGLELPPEGGGGA